MGSNDWLDKIHKDRKASRDKKDLETKGMLERRAIFKAKIDGYWSGLCSELQKVIAEFNSEAETDAQVDVEAVGHSFIANGPSNSGGGCPGRC